MFVSHCLSDLFLFKKTPICFAALRRYYWAPVDSSKLFAIRVVAVGFKITLTAAVDFLPSARLA